MLYERFDQCLCQCKKLNCQSLGYQLADSNWAQLTADKLLYNHAIELVKKIIPIPEILFHCRCVVPTVETNRGVSVFFSLFVCCWRISGRADGRTDGRTVPNGSAG